MSWLRDGKTRTQHKRHKTYEHERVQKRLDSVIPAVQSKTRQALEVDSARVIIYKRAKIGLPCSCTVVANDEYDDGDGMDKTFEHSGSRDYGTTIAPSNQTMFGGMRNTQGVDVVDASATLVMEAGDLVSGIGDEGFEEFSPNALTGNSTNCGICFRQGVQPGYQPHGFLYNVMTHYNVQEMVGYTIDKSSRPHVFERVDPDGFVVFDTVIPMFFKEATYSVRSNELLHRAHYKPDIMLEDGTQIDLTYDALDKLRGKTVRIVVRNVEEFTHATLIFDQGIEHINGNLSEEQNVLNYDQELTVGNIQVALPSDVGTLNPEDILIIPERNYVLKVTEAPKKRTARGHYWEWMVTTRAVQRKEYIFNIHKGFKVF